MGKVKGLVIAILILIILAGTGYGLLFFEIVKPPAFLNRMPIIGKYVAKEKVEAKSEVQLLREENARLKVEIKKKNEEIALIKSDYARLKKELEKEKAAGIAMQEEIMQLNEELRRADKARKDQEAVYKDMANYFASMKVKNAAEIMSNLEDKDIIGILTQMDKETAAQILQNMDKRKAAEITKKMLVVSP
ncbi:Flagellar motility protein MotE, a chaperone for MotC folding [Thermosyntropha lipolytica DSM 11003]|uniref:Flagellar motility protein MotE, a chaperone for MotC folding n=1 Tax=Thermosyntropha lipolytica DSM 11003 TaxID=1123382 RepID=A0A1M5L1G2_9FIRM|nr:hypothetical protein [Thermosyntropha lipolytica]SHG58263.1 Flagellar motility protein MotE, a chaperone for MotC folding [Thermosyntropha lipolytica DSM 11003]